MAGGWNGRCSDGRISPAHSLHDNGFMTPLPICAPNHQGVYSDPLDREHLCWNAEAKRPGATFHLRSRPLVSGGALDGSVNGAIAASQAVSDCTLCLTTTVWSA